MTLQWKRLQKQLTHKQKFEAAQQDQKRAVDLYQKSYDDYDERRVNNEVEAIQDVKDL
jgi:hypothetical protein